MASPFRFGIQAVLPFAGSSWPETARTVEALGYSTLHVPDHFGDQLAPIAAMASALAATERLNVGALVFDNDYRHPVVLAKEMATLDVLFPGRVEFGLGAGWMREDYDVSGLTYDAPRVRVDRFEEALAIVAGHFSGERFDFHGEHYDVDNLVGRPVPVTPGGPKLLIGGGGQRVLSIAARHATIVGINPNMKEGEIGPGVIADAMPDRFETKLGWVRDAAGDRFGEIELNMLCFVVNVTDSDSATDEVAGGIAEMFGVEPSVVLDIAPVLIGTVDQLCERLLDRRDRWGLSYYVVGTDAAEAFAPVVARLAGE